MAKKQRMLNIGIVCYPTYGGSGVVATELGMALARKGHKVHFISYRRPARLAHYLPNVFYHEVAPMEYPLFDFKPMDTALASKIVDVALFEQLDVLHVHYAIPHATIGSGQRNSKNQKEESTFCYNLTWDGYYLNWSGQIVLSSCRI
jgi:glycosyltransferase involved in cell wall biosynthesis